MYQSQLPYPSVNPSRENPYYAAAMLDNIGGEISEMSSAGLYFYHQLTSSSWQELSEAFHGIAMAELHHLEIFGRLAMGLGADPRLWSTCGCLNNRCRFWTPAYLSYHSSLEEMLTASMAAEERSRQKYLMQAAWIEDENVRDNLHRIAEDELLHLQILKSLYQKYIPPA